jgi:hypothetical protein
MKRRVLYLHATIKEYDPAEPGRFIDAEVSSIEFSANVDLATERRGDLIDSPRQAAEIFALFDGGMRAVRIFHQKEPKEGQ